MALVTLLLAGCHGGYGPYYDTPTIDPLALEAALAASPPPLLVDVREPSAFAAGHLPGAVRLDVDDVVAYLVNARVPSDRLIVVSCTRGFSSLAAVHAARCAGFARAHSLHGGMNDWPANAPLEQGSGTPADPALLRPPLRTIGFLDQVVVVMAGLVLKPTYMALSVALVLLLWRARERALRLLRAALATFFAGELACALNYALTGGQSLGLELAHGLGMVAMGTLLGWGLAILLDERVAHYQDPKAICAALRFCQRCWKREPVACPIYRLMLFAGPALAAVSLVPLSVGIAPEAVRLSVFGSEVVYAVPVLQQLVQFRLYPLLAVLSFLAATVILLVRWRAGVRAAQLPFFIGIGLSSFSLGRFVLTYALGRAMPGWADLWEEVTELLCTLLVLVLLVVFWRRLELRWPFGKRSRIRAGSR